MSEGIVISRPVVVKIRITEKYKKKIVAEIQAAVQKIDVQFQHLEYQIKRIAIEIQKQKNTGQLQIALDEVENERLRCQETRHKLVEKLKEIGKLKPGAEVVYCKVDSSVEVHVGDNWQQLMNKEIVLEDDKVIDIRSIVTGKDIVDG